ncbi:MAG: TatD family hydrolase [Acidobacteriota bacterium]|nr:TatD family hydrolase [Acidobacteriota bacterium]
MIDSHCHLAGEEFAVDLADVVARATAAGVTRAVVILSATDDAELARAMTVSSAWPGVRFACGVHPHEAGKFTEAPEAAGPHLRALVGGRNDIPLVGEIGLDYHYDFAPRDVQQRVFRAQLVTARELGMPVVIHTREAWADTLAILREERAGETGGVFHCFTGSEDEAREALDAGFCLSYSGIVTFPKASNIRAAARLTPADRLLTETDSPFLAPVPYRGKRNEPAYVAEVTRRVAEVRGEPVEVTAASAAATLDSLLSGRVN